MIFNHNHYKFFNKDSHTKKLYKFLCTNRDGMRDWLKDDSNYFFNYVNP